MRVPSFLPLLLGFLSAVGPVSTDMYLPAFPAIEAALGGRPGSAQATLAAWFAGLAVGQVSQGALSDRFGRRRPLIAGTALYALASAGCALAPDLLTLSAWRAVAAFGGSASMVITRAVVRDVSEGLAAARLMSRLILVMGVAPILAPSLGGLLVGLAGWQPIFWICAAYGALGTLLVWRFLPDTLPPANRMRVGPGALLARFAGVLRDRSFITHAAMGGFGMFGMFAYIGGSPPVLIGRFGLSPGRYALLFSLAAAGYIAASQVNPLILPRFGAGRVLSWAARTYLLSALAMLSCALTGTGGVLGVMGPVMATLGSMGFMLPNATVGALQRQAHQAGSASALMGTLQFILAAVSGTLIGGLTDGTARPMAALMLLGAVGTTLADRWRRRA